jgi:hypothetical protein
MDLRLVERVSHYVREDASREARDELLDTREVGGVQDVIIDMDVIAEERQLKNRDEDLGVDHRRRFGTLYFMFLYNPPTGERRFDDKPSSTINRSKEHTERSQMDNVCRLVFVK